MANCCEYDMMVVGRDKESLDRFADVLNYEDPEFYLYRVQYVEVFEEPSKDEDSKLWTMKVSGDVAWSAEPWIGDPSDETCKSKTGAHYSNLQEICRNLDIGVEIWTREPGMEFQEHIHVDSDGCLREANTVKWTQEHDEDFNVINETGGFDNYGDWQNPCEIFNPEP